MRGQEAYVSGAPLQGTPQTFCICDSVDFYFCTPPLSAGSGLSPATPPTPAKPSALWERSLDPVLGLGVG